MTRPPFAGGQGRDPRDVRDDAVSWLGLAAVLFAIAILCKLGALWLAMRGAT